MTIFPTHTCFDDSLDLLVEMLRVDPSAVDNLRLVHGLVSLDGRESAHAWVEDVGSGLAYFVGLAGEGGPRGTFMAPANEYRAELKVTESVAYTYREAFELNHASGHYGPWVERYRVCCKGGGR